jgi:D-amino-acid oxidase
MTTLLIQPVEQTTDLEVRRITVPKLDTEHLGRRIVCHRPMREGTPRMDIQFRDGKYVANNYGHGGSGWTLAPGAVNHVITLLEDVCKDLIKEEPLTVLGAGAIGLFTAYQLVQKGYKKITVIAKEFDNLTSHNAGGLLAPVSMNNAPEMQKVVDKIGVEAYKFFASVAKKEHPDFPEGAVIVPTYFETREDSGLEPYVAEKVMAPAKDVSLDFGNGTSRKMVAYDDGIFIDTAQMMTSLTTYLKDKVEFKKQTVHKLKEIATRYIFNCTGLGAKELQNDDKMISVQGHLIMLKNQEPKDLQHMILVYHNDGTTEAGKKVKRSFYIFPKHLPDSDENDVGVLGGTFIQGADSSTPNEKEFDILLEGAKEFYGIKDAV